MTDRPTCSVVVVGGGFAGLSAVRYLLSVRPSLPPLTLTFVHDRPFFEFTPSVLRCIVDPAHVPHVTFAHRLPDVVTIHAKAVCLTPSLLTLSPPSKPSFTIPYDYCIWATGAVYPPPITPVDVPLATFSVSRRQAQLSQYRSQILAASTVLVIGAGPIGVELVSEIAHLLKMVSHTTRITLAISPSGILSGLPRRAGQYVSKQLTNLGVHLLHGRFHKQDDYYTDGHIKVQADVVFECTGAISIATTAPLLDGHVATSDQLSETGRVSVRPTLQLQDHAHIFVAGDASVVTGNGGVQESGREMTTVYGAEGSGQVAGRNVATLVGNEESPVSSLKKYPDDAFGLGKMPRVFDISLGRHDGVMCIGPLVVCGRMAGMSKGVIEWLGVRASGGNRGARAVMWFAKEVSHLIEVGLEWMGQKVGRRRG